MPHRSTGGSRGCTAFYRHSKHAAPPRSPLQSERGARWRARRAAALGTRGARAASDDGGAAAPHQHGAHRRAASAARRRRRDRGAPPRAAALARRGGCARAAHVARRRRARLAHRQGSAQRREPAHALRRRAGLAQLGRPHRRAPEAARGGVARAAAPVGPRPQHVAPWCRPAPRSAPCPAPRFAPPPPTARLSLLLPARHTSTPVAQLPRSARRRGCSCAG